MQVIFKLLKGQLITGGARYCKGTGYKVGGAGYRKVQVIAGGADYNGGAGYCKGTGCDRGCRLS
jgi:hypothetical protein